jgi:uncharacterized protein YcbK (DUF882 family)
MPNLFGLEEPVGSFARRLCSAVARKAPQVLASIALVCSLVTPGMAPPVEAAGQTRTLKLYFIHTKEKAQITYKRNGRYDQKGLQQINRFLRDWRRNEPTKMDPRLLDLVWEVHQKSGSRDYIHVVSAYRSPATNGMLRSRSKGVAKKSQHMLGKAMDFYIPDVKLKTLREVGMKFQVGGVGYYPTSGSPFVHMDVGNVRHWPGISRQELARVFPNGKTLHVPSDGKPLPGFEQALASYESRKKSGTTALALASSPATSSKSRGLLSALFGGGADEEEDNSEGSVVASAPAAEAPTPSEGIRVVPPELANPASVPFSTADEEIDQTPETIIAALPARDIPVPLFAPRPQVDVGATVDPAEPDSMPFGVASGLPDDGSQGEVADASIPLPTWRPDVGETPPALVALAPPTPEGRPAVEEVSVAALDEPEEDDVQQDSQMLAELSQPDAIAVISQNSSPAATTGSVKTTRKADRAARAAKQAAKPQVVAAQPEAARWAIGEEQSLAYDAGGATVTHLLRSVPSEVYATGFQRDTVVADAGRFSGKAVSFMPVARFQTN